MKAQTIRAVIQGLFLLFFLLLFALTKFPLGSPIPVELLLRLDPLAAAISFLAGRTVVPRMLLSLGLLGVTIFLGRFFCGYVCPLGTTIDISDRFLCSKKLARLKIKRVPRLPKYYLLAFLLLLGLLGRSLLWPFDPLVAFTRSLTALLHPTVVFLSNLGLDVFRPLAERWEMDALANAGFLQSSYASWIIPVVSLVVILGLGLLGRRFWCRALCPLGALLALAARLSPLKRVVWPHLCTHCHLCRERCPTGAIGEDEEKTAFGECIACRTCVSVCPHHAVAFRLRKMGSREDLNWDRRRFILASLVGVAAFSLSRIKFQPLFTPRRRIRPPGAVPEPLFLARCLRCGQCMKVCLTNGLQPATDQAGFAGIWTPVLVPRQGPCERHCNLCGQVCPTQAIRCLNLEEKGYVRIGLAQVDQDRCLEWGYGRTCLVCDEVCPYGAIFVGKSNEQDQGRRGPVVDPQICVGCGVCEHHCPVLGEAAIRVSVEWEDRLREGSYITPGKVRARERILKGENSTPR